MGGAGASCAVVNFAGGSGAACAEMAVRATRPASVAIVARILVSIRDNCPNATLPSRGKPPVTV